MVSVDEVGRSLRGALAMVSRRPDALAAFDLSEAGFRRSFAAFVFTIPAFVVSVALERRGMQLDVRGFAVFDNVPLLLAVGLAHVASLVALQGALAWVLRGGPHAAHYGRFVIAMNWIAVFGTLALAAPAALFLMGLEPPGLVALLTLAFAAILIEAQWFTAKVTLAIGSGPAAAVAALGLSLHFTIDGLLRAVIG